jgi:hypothetical protein
MSDESDPPSDASPPGPDAKDWVDRREQFRQLSSEVESTEAERAFLANKIELIQTDAALSDEKKRSLIAELRRRLNLLIDADSKR